MAVEFDQPSVVVNLQQKPGKSRYFTCKEWEEYHAQTLRETFSDFGQLADSIDCLNKSFANADYDCLRLKNRQ